jgi:type 1 glutamine amidotransferase
MPTMRCLALVFCLFSLSLFSTSILADSPKPHVVMLVAEREYETEQTLPAFAKQFLDKDFSWTIVLEDPADRNRLVGIEAIDSADVMVVSMRRRTLSKEQLDAVRRYVAAAKPVIGIRTASHAFCLRKEGPPEGRDAWPEFDRDVLGGHYTNHYGNTLKATVTPETQRSDAAKSFRSLESTEPFIAGGSLYVVSPLVDGTTVLLNGRVEGQASEPVAWTYRRAGGGKSFYTSLGHVDDFRGEVLPSLLVNAIEWCLEK